MSSLNRRTLLKRAAATTAAFSLGGFDVWTSDLSPIALAKESGSDALPMQLYKSLSDEQKTKICLASDHKSRQYISNWWYVHKEHRINNTFTKDQQELIQTIFDSLHNPQHQAAVNKQVKIDQYGEKGNAPSVGFFGTPDDDDFEFIYTGHHVTRRCNAHSDQGQGFGGAPIFYGHFPEQFNEKKNHPGNPYWYQGKLFNKFVQSLNGNQQASGLISKAKPRSEKAKEVVKKRSADWPGLACSELSSDQKKLLLTTMRKMMAMFREDDVKATVKTIEKHNVLDGLYVSWYDGKYDIGSDKVWDTWQIEGPNMVWYFRGQPHIHSYFHLKNVG